MISRDYTAAAVQPSTCRQEAYNFDARTGTGGERTARRRLYVHSHRRKSRNAFGPSPMEKLTNTPCLPLANNEFLAVGQGYQPSLATERAHLSNVIDIHHGVPMNPPKATIFQPLFKDFERLSCLVAPVCGDNPDDVSV